MNKDENLPLGLKSPKDEKPNKFSQPTRYISQSN